MRKMTTGEKLVCNWTTRSINDLRSSEDRPLARRIDAAIRSAVLKERKACVRAVSTTGNLYMKQKVVSPNVISYTIDHSQMILSDAEIRDKKKRNNDS